MELPATSPTAPLWAMQIVYWGWLVGSKVEKFVGKELSFEIHSVRNSSSNGFADFAERVVFCTGLFFKVAFGGSVRTVI